MMKRVKGFSLLLLTWLLLSSMTMKACDSKISSQSTDKAETEQQAATAAPSGEVVLGAARTSEYVPLLKGKRVALFSNQTGR